MTADYYVARAQNGDDIEDASEDGLFMLLQDLEPERNAFVKVTPADGSDWHATVTLRAPGTYEVERSDPTGGFHEVSSEDDLNAVARALTIWFADRSTPGTSGPA